MNHLRITIILLIYSLKFNFIAQTCCDDPNKKFADLADASNSEANMNSCGYQLCPTKWTHDRVHLSEGPAANGYLVPSKKKSDKWLIVIHEWWGLNDHIKEEAEKLWGDLKNVNVLAIDMYDGNVATTREEASQYMQGLSTSRAYSILSGVKQLCRVGC